MKLPNAHVRLALFTKDRRKTPYAWGENDCVTFAADAVWAITGVDPIEDIRGSWDSEEGARAVLEGLGGLIEAVDARFERVDPKFAQRGDVCLIRDAKGEPSLGVCVGAFAAAPGELEMLLTPMSKAKIAWRV